MLDASVALAWCFEDESSPATDRLLESLRDGPALVPGLWPAEVANGLLVAERRGRLTADQVLTLLSFLADLPIELHPTPSIKMSGPYVDTARESGLAMYDASYLHLARERSLAVATVDTGMATAARSMGVPTVP